MDDPITMPPRQLSAGRAFCNVARALQAVGVLVSSVVANVSSSLNRLGGQTPSPLPHWPTPLGPVQAPGRGPRQSRTRARVANAMPVLRCRTWERRLLHCGRGRRSRRRRGAALVVRFARARCSGPVGSGSKPPRARESPRAQSRESLRAPIPRLSNVACASVREYTPTSCRWAAPWTRRPSNWRLVNASSRCLPRWPAGFRILPGSL